MHNTAVVRSKAVGTVLVLVAGSVLSSFAIILMEKRELVALYAFLVSYDF